MAKQDKETYESYAKDMFDNPPAGPMGVHRGTRSMASRALPYVIVVIVALLAGLLFWGVYSGEISNLRMPWSAKEDSSSSVSTADKADKKTDDTSKDAKTENKKSEEARRPVLRMASRRTLRTPTRTRNRITIRTMARMRLLSRA